ncbi:MAG: DNA-binding protein, partial [Oscillospiraceae bacterium]|nr:DNA-binding protein [Oscillospiraceae bacterium]
MIPGMEGPPPPENKVIDLSSVRAGAGQEQKDPAKEGGQEWEKPQEQPEPPRRGRRPKNKEAPAQGERPKRKGRPPKAEKQTPGGGGAGKTAKTATRGKAAGKSAPAKEAAPPPPAPAPAPEEPPQPKDASRGEKEEIVYLDLSQLHPFQ